ncbi:MAG: tryptophan--tRNA ligase [Candidatus Terrybacteria bacterium RIFCSPLOWO2_01_FULL_58_14]|uniref:Tryptophan--tRNA ligase n=2 Tax=Candidatus Terryibacteriota TaxID=1817920 RepID=A0A1G2PVN8_9BACT|nr:MAG: tryptophan--tRNA ligase [Candidatus Terrybacteria bacterium RIFCSPHIGHO2_01_FULL_58_15]OHA52394.1 MAG: tryptophan--tRNA ligase [Candidatus Terrybacteria bacterium RIFCSPLOWO2_01_FULL_58_14]
MMRIVSGIQPSGELHIGNYLGALRQFTALQDEHECFFFLADLHALTELPAPETLRDRVVATAIDYLAVGLDPQKATLFLQSDVPAHAELMWLLATLTPVGDLERMTQYKEKARDAKKRRLVNAGLLTYPILMAADILLYRAEAVPVGEDQLQHLELARRIAHRFNDRFPPPLFPEPNALMQKKGARIMSLADPRKKMSKSHGPETYIGIFDSPDSIRKKIQKAVTDSGTTVSYDPRRKPALANLLTLYALFAEEELRESAQRFSHSGYAIFKQALTELLIQKLSPFRERRQTLAQSPPHIRAVLERGAERALAVSQETLREARTRMGIA